MLGTFLCNLLTNNTEFQSDHGGLNTHASGYSDTDEMFHSNTDAERILGYTDSEQEEFFKKFKDKFLLVHYQTNNYMGGRGSKSPYYYVEVY